MDVPASTKASLTRSDSECTPSTISAWDWAVTPNTTFAAPSSSVVAAPTTVTRCLTSPPTSDAAMALSCMVTVASR